MKNSWFVGAIIVGVVITVLVAFNYQGKNEVVPLSEIFPEEETFPVDVEYEFVDENNNTTTEAKVKEIETTPIVTQAAVQTPVKRQVDVNNIAYTIQVASFKKKSRADTALDGVTKKGYEGFIVSKDLGEKGTWYRLYVGEFHNKGNANTFLTQFKEDFPGSFVISLK